MAASKKDSGTGGVIALLVLAALMVWAGIENQSLAPVAIGAVLAIVALALRAAQRKARSSRRSHSPTGLPPGWRALPATDLRPTWPAFPQDFNGRFSSIHAGRAYKRRVMLFTTPGTTAPRTWLAISLHGRPADLTATSDGRTEVRVQGGVTPELRELLKRWRASRMLQLVVRSGTLFVELPPLGNAEIPAFLQQKLPGLVQIVHETIDSEQARQASVAATQEVAPSVPEPLPAPRPLPEPEPQPAPEPLPAPEPAPGLLDWKPTEWTPTPFDLGTPISLTPTTGETGTGWKPREWTPPTYGREGEDR